MRPTLIKIRSCWTRLLTIVLPHHDRNSAKRNMESKCLILKNKAKANSVISHVSADWFIYLLFFSKPNRPVAGSLTEARGQRANIHVFKEMLELCEIICSEGYSHCKETPKLKVILFGELFNVSHIRKHTIELIYLFLFYHVKFINKLLI